MKNKKFGLTPFAIAALAVAAVLFLVSVITALLDVSTFINRLYTTILCWNIPLVAIGLVVYSFVVNGKENQSNVANWVSVGLIVVAFFFSNVTKNLPQDLISNVDNYVSVASKAVVEEAPNFLDWEDELADAAEDAREEMYGDNDRDYDRDYDRRTRYDDYEYYDY